MFKAHLKLIVLKELSEKSLSGYDLIRNLSKFGEKPSPGYIYPLLKDLQNKGFISLKREGRRKVYTLTGKGERFLGELQKNREEMLSKMKKFWNSIANKNEVEEIVETGKHISQDRMIFKNGEGERLYRNVMVVYKKDDKARIKRMLKILSEASNKLEKLK